MPKPTISVSRSGRQSGMVFVDAFEVREAINAIESAVNPVGLAVFMRGMVAPYFQDQIVDRFAEHGGGQIGGSWAPLEESTERIRHALGYYDDEAVNERTGELLDHLLTNQIQFLGLGVDMQIPQDTSDTELNKKVSTAQAGHVQGPNEMIPGAVTPPRPVLGIDSTDLAAVLVMLQTHVMIYASSQLASIGSLP